MGIKKPRLCHPSTLSIYGKKLSQEGLTSDDMLNQDKVDFKTFLEKEFESSKNYKSELKWFDGAWSRFKPGLGKDKRGESGVVRQNKDKSDISATFNIQGNSSAQEW